MSRDVAQDMQPPGQKYPRRMPSYRPEQRKQNTPDDQAVSNVVSLKNVIRKDGKWGRSGDLPQYPLAYPVGAGHVKEAKREEVRCHPQTKGGGKLFAALRIKANSTPKTVCQDIHRVFTMERELK